MGLSGLKCARMGAQVKAVLRVSNALVWSGPQANGVSLGEANQGDDNVREPYNELAIKIGKPKNAWTALRLVRVSQTLTTLVLAMSMEMPVGVTMKPRNSIFCMWNRHFSGLECKSYSQRCSRMHQMWTQCSSR